MPGPGIASATISVDLDGKRIPGEAAILGREAGAAMGREHSKAYENELDNGLSRVGQKLTNEFRQSGRSSALSFRDAFESNVTKEMDRVAQDVANVFSDPKGFTKFRQSIAGVDEDMATVGRSAEELRNRLEFLRSNGQFGPGLGGYNLFQSLRKDINDWEKSAGTAEVAATRVRRALGDVGSGGRIAGDGIRAAENDLAALGRSAGGAEGNLKNLGDGFDRVGRSARNSRGGMGLWTVAIVALIGLVVTLLPELSALGSALGGIGLEGGLAFGALAVGAVTFVAAMKGIFGPLKDLPAAVQPAAKALQSIFGADDAKGKFVAGGMLHQLQVLIQTHVFENLAGSITKFATGAFPAFKTGLISVSDALNQIAREFATAFTEPQNLQNFQKFFVGLGPILQALGSAAIDFGQGMSGIFAAATPFALDFAKAIHGIAERFGDFFASQKGQDQVVLFLTNANNIAGHLGKAFGDIGQALHEMVTPGSIKNLNLVLDAIGGLALGIGALGVAITPAAVGISALLDLVSHLLITFGPTISNVFDGISSFVVGVVKFLTPVADFLAATVINPIAKVVGSFLAFMGEALGVASGDFGGFLGGLSAALQPVIDLLVNGFIGAMKLVIQIIEVAKPTIDGIGAVFLAVGRGVGSIIGAFFDVGASVLDFKGKTGDLESFIHGPLAQAFDVLGGKLQDFASFITDTAVPYIKTQLIPAFTDFWTNIQNNVVPAIEGFLPTLGQIGDVLLNQVIPAIESVDFGKMVNALIIFGTDVAAVIDILGNMVSAFISVETAVFNWGQVIVNTVGIALVAIGGIGKAIVQIGHLDFMGALQTAQDVMGSIGGLSVDLANTFKTAVTNTGAAAKQFGGSATNVAKDIAAMENAGKSAFQSLSKQGQADLNQLASNLHLTGTKAQAFEGVVASVSGNSKSKLQALAKDGSLAEVERTLGLTGAKARAFEAQMALAMSGAGHSSDVAKGKVDDLHYAVRTLPNGKTVVITETGAAAAQAAVEALNSQLRALHDRQVTITAVSNISPQLGRLAQLGVLGAHGGIMAGGQMLAGGEVAFANGGILTSATRFGNVIAGEAGAEAIVPLTGPLSKVDASVRQLAAFARGMGDGFSGPQKVVTVNQTINVPTSDPATVAGYVVDRLVPQI